MRGGEGRKGVPRRAVLWSKSVRTCKGKVISIRQLLPRQYSIRKLRILLYKDGYRDQALPSGDRKLSPSWGEAWQFLVHLGQLSHVVMSTSFPGPRPPRVRRGGGGGKSHSYYPDCLLRFRKIKTVS